ncbi:hypothetical protein GCM10011504_00910 [Siccirubricoccus deserti]|uniref:EAL domain-containing protein n=1 Tax=Siccirubricoccus deserti TaxID=2013562 RepID=A0A9X0QWC8_9PROT|nr:EAL domain-containing protein [Siccirubricoccus deserti]MBC4014103.1 EAL domain-containing protein [Siccirubricoccus deserti]GGC26448.1 hypothetical protein GCM10011504_00910 [Siccirubricoccus deserti]
MTTRHRLLDRQLAQARQADGAVDLDVLLALVATTYDHADLDRLRVERASALMAEELDQTNASLEASVATLAQQNMHFTAALENMSDGLCLYDPAGHCIVWNTRLLELLRVPHGVVRLGTPLAEMLRHSVLAEGGEAAIAAALTRTLQPRHGAELRPQRLALPDGRTLITRRRQLPDGCFVTTFEDVTERLRAEADLHRMAQQDALTGLPNRVALHRRLEEVLEACRLRSSFALLTIDLDRFKEVNDTLGHAAGDRLLREMAARCRGALRQTDTLARFGGDEFAVIIDPVTVRQDAAGIAERLIEAIRQPIWLEGTELVIGTSIGIALPGDAGVAADPGQLMRAADLALHAAKAEGGNRACFFEPAMDDKLRARRSLEGDLRQALAAGELAVHFQPQVELGNTRIIGAEALVRWHHPERGAVPPTDFIPLAEDTGLIGTLGEHVLRQACLEAVGWAPLRIAVNVSPLQFRQRDLAETFARILAETGFDPRRLEVEITEGALLQDSEQTLEKLRRLKALGVRIVLDDFGTGYSSLSYLRQFPFDKLKIDSGFVRGMDRSAESAAIIRAVIGLSHSLGIRVNAEGVETSGQLQALRREGCEEAQGYLFGRPMPPREFAALLRDQAVPTLAVAPA